MVKKVLPSEIGEHPEMGKKFANLRSDQKAF